MHSLSDFLGEAEWNDLTEAFRRNVPLMRPAPKPDRFRALWSDWELEAICRFTTLPESETFRLFAKGNQVPAATYIDRRGTPSLATVRQLWNSGVSINFARLEHYSNSVLAMVRALEAARRLPGRVHFFTTPRQAQALGVHADHADVLVLQVQGEKTWDVYHTAPRWVPGAPAAEIALAGQKPETVTLHAGGWLYLPLGVYHEVRNRSDAPSTHFTVGFHALSWGALLERTLEVAKQQAPLLLESVAVAGALEATDEDIGRRLEALRPFIVPALQADHYGEPVPPAALTPRDRLNAAVATTRFVWRRESVTVRPGAGRIELQLPFRTEPLKLRAEFAPAAETMIGRETFCPADLGGDPETDLLLCKFLANVGVLRLGGSDTT